MIEKAKQVAFLNSLYAIFFNSAGQFAPNKVNIQNSVSASEALSVWRALGPDEEVVELLAEVRKGKNVELKPFGVFLKKMVQANPEWFGPRATSIILKFAAYFRTGSESAARVIHNISGATIFPEWIRQGFQAKKIDQSSVSQQLKEFVSRNGGKKGDETLSIPKLEELRARDLNAYKEYQRLRKEFNSSWQNAAVNFLRNSDEKMVPMKSLLAFLEKEGLRYSIVPGFTGKVSLSEGNTIEWYTNDGERIAGVPSPNFFDRVEMNSAAKKADAFIFTAIPKESNPDSKPKYFYRASDLRKRKEQKFQMIQEVAPRIQEIRTVWLQGIKHFSLDDDKTVAALLLELSYEFASRIGTEGNSTKGAQTFGLSTTLVRHLKMIPNGFTLTYPGKDGVRTSHKYVVKDATSRTVLDCLKQLVLGKEPSDPIFTVGEGESAKPIRPAVVNHVFKKLSGHARIGSHKMRTLRGTVLFNELATVFIKKNKGAGLSAKQVEDAVKEMAGKVGQVLNHVRTAADGEPKVTGETALNAYIDPGTQQMVFDALSVPYPKSLLKRIGQNRIDSKYAVMSSDPEDTPQEVIEPDQPEEPEEPGGRDPVEDLSEDGGEVEPTDELSLEEEMTPGATEEDGGEFSDSDLIEPDVEDDTEPEPEVDESSAPDESEPGETEEPPTVQDEDGSPKKDSETDSPTPQELKRQAAEESAEEDSRLLAEILANPGLADDR